MALGGEVTVLRPQEDRNFTGSMVSNPYPEGPQIGYQRDNAGISPDVSLKRIQMMQEGGVVEPETTQPAEPLAAPEMVLPDIEAELAVSGLNQNDWDPILQQARADAKMKGITPEVILENTRRRINEKKWGTGEKPTAVLGKDEPKKDTAPEPIKKGTVTATFGEATPVAAKTEPKATEPKATETPAPSVPAAAETVAEKPAEKSMVSRFLDFITPDELTSAEVGGPAPELVTKSRKRETSGPLAKMVGAVDAEMALETDLGKEFVPAYREGYKEAIDLLGGLTGDAKADADREAKARNYGLAVARSTKAAKDLLAKDASPAPQAPAASAPSAGPGAPVDGVSSVATPPGLVTPALVEASAKAAGLPSKLAADVAPQFGAATEPPSPLDIATVAKTPAMAAMTEAVVNAEKAQRRADALQVIEQQITEPLLAAQNDLELARELEVQRRLQAAEAAADRLRADVEAGYDRAERLAGAEPAGWQVVLGALGGMSSGGGESFSQWFDRQIDRDMDRQYSLLSKKQGLLKMYMDQTGDIKASSELARASMERIRAYQVRKVAGPIVDERLRMLALTKSESALASAREKELKAFTDLVEAESKPVNQALTSARLELDRQKFLWDQFEDRKARTGSAKAGSAKAVPSVGAKAAFEAGYATPEQYADVRKTDPKNAANFVALPKVVSTSGETTLSATPEAYVFIEDDPTKKDLKQIRSGAEGFLTKWNAAARLARKHGYQPVSTWTDRKDVGTYQALSDAMIPDLGKIQELGVLQPSDRASLAIELSPNGLFYTGQFSEAVYREKARLIADGYREKVRSMADVYIGPDGIPTPVGGTVKLKDPKTGVLYEFPKANEAAARARGLVNP